MSKNMKKKLANELFYLGIAVLGIVILVLNLTKTCNPESAFAWIVAYGFLIGPILTVLGIGGFFEVRDTIYPKRGAC